jgi:hypothetical protein
MDYLTVAEQPDSVPETAEETAARLRASDIYFQLNNGDYPDDAFAAGWKAAKAYYELEN